jgi:hypothetical protein
MAARIAAYMHKGKPERCAVNRRMQVFRSAPITQAIGQQEEQGQRGLHVSEAQAVFKTIGALYM